MAHRICPRMFAGRRCAFGKNHMTLIEIVLAILGSNVLTALLTQFLNRRKTDADANHISVETANDVNAMLRTSYEWRISTLESQVLKLKEDYAKDITNLSNRLAGTFQTIKVLLARIKVLSIALRKSGGDVPEWPDEPDTENI